MIRENYYAAQKAQIGLHMCAGPSGPSFSAYRTLDIIGLLFIPYKVLSTFVADDIDIVML